MTGSPKTPRRRRPSSAKSSVSFHGRHSRGSSLGDTGVSGSPFYNGTSNVAANSSPQSLYMRRQSSYEVELISPETSQGGLGSLADELAEALSEEEDTYRGNQTSPSDRAARSQQLPTQQTTTVDQKKLKESGGKTDGNSNPTNNEDAEDLARLQARLESQLSAIESLVRQSSDEMENEGEVDVGKFTASLKSLPAQVGIENGASRLMTTHAALTAHISGQARVLQTLLHHLVAPVLFPPESDFTDDFLPLIGDLLSAIPAQNSDCLSALHHLSSATSDLQSTLTYLSDSVYMGRQTMMAANRTLRTLTTMVIDLRHEAEANDEAIRFIESGGWNQRLLARECKTVCSEVVGGFEQICESWRQRLVASSV